jgi:hypothetical protein
MNQLVIWGAGGHGKVVWSVAQGTGRYRTIRFLDDDPSRVGQMLCGCPIEAAPYVGSEADLEWMIAIGQNPVRGLRHLEAHAWGISCASLVHYAAVVDDSASVGRGTVVMAGAIVNAQARIGVNCIINTGAYFAESHTRRRSYRSAICAYRDRRGGLTRCCNRRERRRGRRSGCNPFNRTARHGCRRSGQTSSRKAKRG